MGDTSAHRCRALWDNYQPAARLITLPGVLNILKRNTFGIYAKLAGGGMRHAA